MLKYSSINFISSNSHNSGFSLPNFSVISLRLHRIVPLCSLSCNNVVVSSGSLQTLSKSNEVVRDNIRGGKRMNWFHEVKLEVRGYELDQFGVVNNAVYANYCQYGQFDLYDKIGMEADKLAIKELSLKYIAPLRRRDKFVLKVRICDLYAARIRLETLIFKLPNLEPILEAKSTLVWLDNSHRPTRIPSEMLSKFNQYLVDEMGAKYQQNGCST